MKIEYLDGDQWPLPLVRLFDFGPDEVRALRRACMDLALRRLAEFPVHEQGWAQAVSGCQFIWRTSENDAGVRRPCAGQPLVLEYSAEAWREVAGKLTPFIRPLSTGFNRLTMEGDVHVLISHDGKWQPRLPGTKRSRKRWIKQSSNTRESKALGSFQVRPAAHLKNDR